MTCAKAHSSSVDGNSTDTWYAVSQIETTSRKMARRELHQPESCQPYLLAAEEKFLVVWRLGWDAWISPVGEPTNLGKSHLPTERLLPRPTDTTSLVPRYFLRRLFITASLVTNPGHTLRALIKQFAFSFFPSISSKEHRVWA